jgi:hypothetical protein
MVLVLFLILQLLPHLLDVLLLLVVVEATAILVPQYKPQVVAPAEVVAEAVEKQVLVVSAVKVIAAAETQPTTPMVLVVVVALELLVTMVWMAVHQQGVDEVVQVLLQPSLEP